MEILKGGGGRTGAAGVHVSSGAKIGGPSHHSLRAAEAFLFFWGGEGGGVKGAGHCMARRSVPPPAPPPKRHSGYQKKEVSGPSDHSKRARRIQKDVR